MTRISGSGSSRVLCWRRTPPETRARLRKRKEEVGLAVQHYVVLLFMVESPLGQRIVTGMCTLTSSGSEDIGF